MSFSSALKLLTAGEFVCNIRYLDEFEALDSPEGRERADAWLGAAGYRLCQLEDGGAFFMAYKEALSAEERATVREQFRNLRDMLQPAVRYLETVRQAQGRGEQLQPGQEVALSAVIEAVRASTSLDRRLEQMKDVYGSRTGEASTDRIARILELLEKEGYLYLSNPSLKVYVVTGKIVYAYQLLAIMAEFTPQMNESDDTASDKQIEISPAPAESPAQGTSA